jgi:hypothetical protein
MTNTASDKSTAAPFFRPLISSEHGGTVTLAVCFLLGSWLARSWNWTTSIALVTVFAAFEVQLPLVRLVRRRQLDSRHRLWGMIYGSITIAGAGWLLWKHPILIRVYAVGSVVLIAHLWGVFRRQRRNAVSELGLFAGLCLALPTAFVAASGYMADYLLGLWLLSTAVFSQSIFTVRIRLSGDAGFPGAVGHLISSYILVAGLIAANLLDAELVWLLLIPTTKLLYILIRTDEYRLLRLAQIGLLETGLAILYAIGVIYYC